MKNKQGTGYIMIDLAMPVLKREMAKRIDPKDKQTPRGSVQRVRVISR